MVMYTPSPGTAQTKEICMYTHIIPARDPKQWGGAKGDETSGGDDDDDDTQMRAHRGADI